MMIVVIIIVVVVIRMMMMINDHYRSLNPCLVCQMQICIADGVDGDKNEDEDADDNDVHYDY